MGFIHEFHFSVSLAQNSERTGTPVEKRCRLNTLTTVLQQPLCCRCRCPAMLAAPGHASHLTVPRACLQVQSPAAPFHGAWRPCQPSVSLQFCVQCLRVDPQNSGGFSKQITVRLGLSFTRSCKVAGQASSTEVQRLVLS